MITSGYFEICTVIVLKNENNIKDAAIKLERTINSLLDQDKKPCKICIMDIECTIPSSDITKWINEVRGQIYNNGIIDFKYRKMRNKENTFKQNLIEAYKGFIDKPLGIKINTQSGERKSKLRVSHFAIINAGNTYSINKFYSNIKDVFMGNGYIKEDSLILYTDMKCRNKSISTKIANLSDDSQCIYFSYGFKYYIDSKDDIGIIDTYKEMNEERKKISNNLNTNVKTLVFSKTKKGYIIKGG